jgi:hypothetical protein
MDCCEEGVIIALPSCRRRKSKNTGFIKCFKPEKRKKNFILWTSER